MMVCNKIEGAYYPYDACVNEDEDEVEKLILESVLL